jgi:hypothetical protein
MAERLPRLHQFAVGLRRLRASDPQRSEALSSEVRRYMRLLTLFGAREADVPKRYRLGRVLAYSLRQLSLLTLVLPVAAVGYVVWLVPLKWSQWVVPRFRPELDQVATYKVSSTLVGFPVWLALCVAGTWFLAGTRPSLIVLGMLPITGLAAIAWRDRQAEVREDLSVFLRARRLSRGRDRLAELRRHLVQEFDALAREWSEG